MQPGLQNGIKPIRNRCISKASKSRKGKKAQELQRPNEGPYENDIYYLLHSKGIPYGMSTRYVECCVPNLDFSLSLFLLDFDFYICTNNPMEVHLNARLFVLWQQMCAANKKVCIVQRNRLDIAAVIRPVCNFMVLAWLGFVLGWNIHNIKPDNSRKRPNEQ